MHNLPNHALPTPLAPQQWQRQEGATCPKIRVHSPLSGEHTHQKIFFKGATSGDQGPMPGQTAFFLSATFFAFLL
jgi:hypothetical protein